MFEATAGGCPWRHARFDFPTKKITGNPSDRPALEGFSTPVSPAVRDVEGGRSSSPPARLQILDRLGPKPGAFQDLELSIFPAKEKTATSSAATPTYYLTSGAIEMLSAAILVGHPNWH